MNSTMQCLLFLTCVVAIGWATHHCPRSWIGNPFSCEVIICNSTKDCNRSGVSGICCRTTCGGQDCYFESVRIARQAPPADRLRAKFCPLAPWVGQSSQQCNRHECSANEQCVRQGVRGLCCVTSCGGYNCHYPEHRCPASANWTGLNDDSCTENMCSGDQDCDENGLKGICCETSCGGQNCFFPKTASPAPAERSKRGSGHWYFACPIKARWVGVSAKKCSQELCTLNSHCGDVGACCATKCGGKSCFVPKIPSNL